MTLKGHQLLCQSGVHLEKLEVFFELDMSYMGQTHTLAIPLPLESTLNRDNPNVDFVLTKDLIQSAFNQTYCDTYSRLLDETPVRVMSLKGALIGRRPNLDLSSLRPAQDSTVESAYRGIRNLYYGGQMHQATVYDRLALPTLTRIEGPALLEQPDTTILICLLYTSPSPRD